MTRPSFRDQRAILNHHGLTGAWSATLVRVALFTLAATVWQCTLATHAGERIAGCSKVACGKLASIWQWREPAEEASWNYVIAHGMGGTTGGDRFHLLADAIQREIPTSRVVLIDWSPSASKTRHGILWPWDVAREIDPVADEAAWHLSALEIDPRRTTFIGESFGCYVVGQIAAAMRGSARILAFNPANECGGYKLPDLTQAAAESWSFHTYSPYDTTQPIAHADLFLETPADADFRAQHMFGMEWLAGRLNLRDRSWLDMARETPTRDQWLFLGKATLNGELAEAEIRRDRQSAGPVAGDHDLPIKSVGDLAGARP